MLSSEELFEKVEKLRQQKGLTFAKFNELAGISHSTLNSWKTRGTYPKIDILDGIAVALGVPLAELLFDIDVHNLSPDEVELLSLWKELNNEQKKAIILTIKAMR